MIAIGASRRRGRVKLALAALVLVMVPALPVVPAAGAPTAPTGVTAIALDGQVSLSWKPVAGAVTYQVLRSTTLGGATTQVGMPTSTTFTNTGTTNGTTYYYTVKAVDLTASPASAPVQVTPRARTCTTGNVVVVENCYPGTTTWKSTGGPQVQAGGIEGFATKTSINRGESVDLKVNTQDGKPYRVEVYRSGWYGGSQGRLISILPSRTGTLQPSCQQPAGNTGLTDCSNWTTTSTITTSAGWPSGVYLLRLVRTDNGADNHVLLTVRDDARTPAVSYIVPVAHYSAYNNYGGKSLYDFNSSGATTVAGTTRAVKVSFDRPQNLLSRDWYTSIDVQNVSWLEREGYDASYATSVDLHAGIPNLNARKAIVSGSHDEYWSSQMRTAVTNARNQGTGVLFLGANGVYWKIRYESSPVSSATHRVVVCYKSTQSGAPDPSGDPTGTWRDPLGANQPENALIGVQYIGDNDSVYFPLRVSAAEGKHRIWRYTSLGSLPTGSSDTIGQNLVGWEWDARAANGSEPAGVSTVASTPVSGSLLLDAGRVYGPGSAVQQSTYYKAGTAGGVVFSTGTNHWSRGLGLNQDNVGEPASVIMQATVNALQDMGTRPTTPANVTLDGMGAPQVTARTPAPDATGVATTSTVTATFDSSPDPSTVTAQSFTLTRSGGASVQASVTYDEATRTATLTPSSQLDGVTSYTATLTTAIKGWNGMALASPLTWSFTTRSGSPPQVSGRTPAPGATGVAFNEKPTATFDRDMTASTINNQSFTLTPSGGTAVQATVAYDAGTRTATLTPSALLNGSTTYTARVSTAAQASDGAPLASDVTWTFTTKESPGPFTVTSRWPAPLATGISPAAAVRGVFSRSVDPATLTTQTFTLKDPEGAAVAAAVTYNEATKTATLTPSEPLQTAKTYTATLTTGVKGAEDGQPLADAVTWTFSTASTPPPPPAVSATSPAASATGVPLSSVVRATFDRSMDPGTLTGQTFTLTGPSGPPLVASVGYDDATRTATLTPGAALAVATTYTARVTAGARSSVGAPMTSDVTFTFTTVDCPCSIFASSLTPVSTDNDTRDGRGGPGPFSYELGVRFTVDAPVQLTALKYYKDANETGTHVGRLWNSSGTQLAAVTYQSETASGWQRQSLSSPIDLQPGTVYVASVGVNARFVVTLDALSSTIVSGPLRTLGDGNNGVHSQAAGQFPTSSYRTSNYFVDVVVKGATTVLPAPNVIGQQPAAGASGTDPEGKIKATFDQPMDASTITASTFTLTGPSDSTVAASVSYDSSARTATLTPSTALSSLTTYTARVSTAVKSQDGVALAGAVSWSFTTAADPPPTVTSTSPADAATQVSAETAVRATFSQAMDAATLNATTFSLEPTAGGASVAATVSYDGATRTATLQPTAALGATTGYTARLTGGVRSANGTALAPASWSFTTSGCPCRLFASSLTPQATDLDTRDGRSGTGPWSYELGVKFQVRQPARLVAIRYYQSPGETGTHIGRLWTAAGAQISGTTFATPTAAGWHEQALATPVDLAPGQVYTLSVGFNAFFSLTGAGLADQIVSGPLRSVADGANGVYGASAGTFPTSSWNDSNYFVDPVVR